MKCLILSLYFHQNVPKTLGGEFYFFPSIFLKSLKMYKHFKYTRNMGITNFGHTKLGIVRKYIQVICTLLILNFEENDI